jgi:copper transport protein
MKCRFILSTLILFCWVALVVAPALAHAELVRSLPAANAALDRPPAQIELFFSETLEPSFSAIKVFDANGAQVDGGDSRVDPTDSTHLLVSLRSLPDGVYTVSWQALSATDGHITSGAFPFAVGNVDAAALAAAEQASKKVILSPGEVIARWLLYLAAAVLTGGMLFMLAVWRPAYQWLQTETGQPLSYPPPWRRLATLALLMLGVAQVVGLLVQAGLATGSEVALPWSPTAGQILFNTRYGALWIARLVLILLLAGLLRAMVANRTRWLAFGGSLLLLFTISLGSHAASETQPVLPVLADWLHLLAASVWVGGLVYFVAALWAVRELTPAVRTRLAAQLIPRFSTLALVSVGMLTLSGLYSAILRVGTLAALTGTLYGQTLVVKLIIALPMVLLGAVNLLSSRPQLKRAALRSAGDSTLVTRFRRLVGGEVILGSILLLSVGVLTSLPPAQITSTSALSASTTTDDLGLALNITPGRVGINTFSLEVTAAGRPVPDAKEVALRFTPTSANLPPSEAQLIGQGQGQYTTKGAYLSLPDTWQVQVVVRREGRFDAFANFNFDVSPTATASAYPWQRVNGALLLLAALAYVFALRSLSRTRPQLIALGVAPGLALVLVGVLVFYRPSSAAQAGQVNPIPPNVASVGQGQALYDRNCVPCHGPTGKGDGPVGLTLNPHPADLSQHAVPGVHTDGQLYDWISHGFPGSAMPAFASTLTEEERWHLVNYIRTLAPK